MMDANAEEHLFLGWGEQSCASEGDRGVFDLSG